MAFTELTKTSELIYDGRIIRVRSDTVTLVNGATAGREVVEHPGGVAIVPVHKDKTVTLVTQYRYPAGRELLEVPAGKLEYGEDPFVCAQRELSEETGLSASSFVYLGQFYPSPGFCKEILHIYLATGLSEGAAHLDEDEFLDVTRQPLSGLIADIMDNKLTDAKTIIGLLKADLYLQQHPELLA